MISYGDAIAWSIKNEAVMRFVNKRDRPDFISINGSEGIALEMAVTIEGRTIVSHRPLEFSASPANAVARAVIECVEFFLARQSSVLSLN
jgi:hypothetical protein